HRSIKKKIIFFFASIRRHTISKRDWSSDVCSSDLGAQGRRRQAHRRQLPCAPGPDHDGEARTSRTAQRVASFLSSRRALHGGLRSEERRVGKECIDEI